MSNAMLRQYELNAPQAAGYLQISLGHLYNLLSRGRGPACIRYGGQLRFRREELDAWITRRCRRCDPET